MIIVGYSLVTVVMTVVGLIMTFVMIQSMMLFRGMQFLRPLVSCSSDTLYSSWVRSDNVIQLLIGR